MINSGEEQIDFDCTDCGRHFCTEDPDHSEAKDGMCGYCSEDYPSQSEMVDEMNESADREGIR